MPGTPPAQPATSGTLYVVATPIGNLGDVTMRALEILRTVPLIAAEDTRLSRRLLARYEIETHAVSYHVRSGPGRAEELLAHLRDGADLALITDAGTPAVSDPGAERVATWAGEGGTVVAIPGASAVLAAIAGSAIAGPRWGFEGFLPRSGRERKDRLARIAADDRSTILFEAPTRLATTLRDLAAACGADRGAEVHRELTKLHEQIARGTFASLETAVTAGAIPARGEVVIVVEGAPTGAKAMGAGLIEPALTIEQARDRVAALVRQGQSRSEAARRTAAETGLDRRRLYREVDPA